MLGARTRRMRLAIDDGPPAPSSVRRIALVMLGVGALGAVAGIVTRNEASLETVQGSAGALRSDDETPGIVETPLGFERVDVAGVAPTAHGHAVVLATPDRALPIFVGETEGLAIELRLMGGHFHRPLTHDLVDAMLADLGGHIESVRVEREEGHIFYSVVVLLHEGRRSELDARTSDAIALALGNHVPIFVSRTILDAEGVHLDELDTEGEEGNVTPTLPDSPPRSTITL